MEIGAKYHRLTVVRPVSFTDRRGRIVRKCECKCDCGKTTIVRFSQVVSGMSKSCGCYNKERIQERKYDKRGVLKLPPDRTGFNRILYNYKHSARSRGFEFSLTTDQFSALTKGNCRYCGSPPSNTSTKQYKFCPSVGYSYNGIDRLDSTKGYVDGNCVPCCKICNFAKRNRSVNEFIGHCRSVVAYQKEVESCNFSKDSSVSDTNSHITE